MTPTHYPTDPNDPSEGGTRRYCPRKKHWQPRAWFQDPVSICLPCYSSNRGNEDLDGNDIDELRRRAKKARKGKYLENERRTQRATDALLGRAEGADLPLHESVKCNGCGLMSSLKTEWDHDRNGCNRAECIAEHGAELPDDDEDVAEPTPQELKRQQADEQTRKATEAAERVLGYRK